jgi:prepilin-type N-terminal cleavage/methylation domain-containing protein
MTRRHGFTLLEILIALVLGLMLLLIAVPSVSGMIRERNLRETFQRFDNFVRSAQTKAMTNRRTYVMVWDEKGIDLVPLDPTAPDSAPVLPPEGVEPDTAAEEPTFFEFTEEAAWTLQRPAALVKKPIWEWPFWRSGLCEPVIVHYESEAGSWSAEYSGLTGRGRVTAMEVK